jgi:stearoyl-CoA desaturase (delta-9 desaturase)
MAIAVFLVSHWFLSLFGQTFFHHRYASHRMFRMSPFWERIFFFYTFVTQGSSYLQPKAYAIMHRLHHQHSDTARDPHSPQFFKGAVQMMWSTFRMYRGLVEGTLQYSATLSKNVPEWSALDRIADPWVTRVFFMVSYATFYFFFATQWWMWLFLPLHFVMGPVQGAIVNWCGHKYGYVNFVDTNDNSRNVVPIDVVLCGELFQNNHHKFPSRPNFAFRIFELDPTYPVIRLLGLMRIIHLTRA